MSKAQGKALSAFTAGIEVLEAFSRLIVNDQLKVSITSDRRTGYIPLARFMAMVARSKNWMITRRWRLITGNGTVILTGEDDNAVGRISNEDGNADDNLDLEGSESYGSWDPVEHEWTWILRPKNENSG